MSHPALSKEPSNHRPSAATLADIAGWQLLPAENGREFHVELPKLQRGFVWEPARILELWDSLLRGFPIGSMLVSNIAAETDSQAEAGPGRYWLLDGQQRATSIALGFYNPWSDPPPCPKMWSVKSIPVLWLDLLDRPQKGDNKLFFLHLVTQSHPWGYTRHGGVIAWGHRRDARDAFGLGDNYTRFDLSRCFPWQAHLPVPLALLQEAARTARAGDPAMFWQHVKNRCIEVLPESWKERFSARMEEPPAAGLESLLRHLQQLPHYHVHLNVLSKEAAQNDTITEDDNSLLFVRLNTGGVVLGGEELIFSLFKSSFGEAKDAVEKAAAGFMVPSRLFGLLVRLVAARENREKLSQAVTLNSFKEAIQGESPLKKALTLFIEKDVGPLLQKARHILCGEADFALPEAVATRTINASPDVFLALLYWLDRKGDVEAGSEKHRQLLGRFTALSWFMPGSARHRQQALRDWVEAAGAEVPDRLWSADTIKTLFLRADNAVPVFPAPQHLAGFLHEGVIKAKGYHYDTLFSSLPHAPLWEGYAFLPQHNRDAAAQAEHRENNLRMFLDRLHPARQMLLYAQASLLQRSFKDFGQWEVTLKDTNCPWDWDHIYPSAYYRKSVDPVYKDWHNTIGNLRAVGLSENRGDGSDWPSHKLAGATAEEGQRIRADSFIPDFLWETRIKKLSYRGDMLRDPTTAQTMSEFVLERLVEIYRHWHDTLQIGALMEEIQSDPDEIPLQV